MFMGRKTENCRKDLKQKRQRLEHSLLQRRKRGMEHEKWKSIVRWSHKRESRKICVKL